MATLEEILGLALGAGSAQVAKDDPYIGLAGTGNDIGQLFIKEGASGKYGKNSTRDAILGAAISGLFGGAMGSLSSDYQSDRLLKYNDLLGRARGGEDVTGDSSVTSALAKTAQNQANQSKLIQDAVAQDETRKLRNQVALKASENLLSDPQTSASLLSQILGVKVPEATPIAAPAETATGRKTLDQLRKEAIIEGRSLGLSRGDIDNYAEKKIADKTQSVSSAQKELEAIKNRIDETDNFLSIATQGIAKAGNTGSAAANAGGWLNRNLPDFMTGSNQQDEIQGDKLLDMAQQKSLDLNFTPGKGGMSDFESKAIFAAGVGRDSPKAANIAAVEQIKLANELNREYVNFKSKWLTGYGTDEGADSAWQAYKKNAGVFIQDDNGALKINPDRPSWKQFGLEGMDLLGSGQTPTTTPTLSTPKVLQTIPAGYELTGKVDANGNQGIRKIR
jgi:hypothetical protein